MLTNGLMSSEFEAFHQFYNTDTDVGHKLGLSKKVARSRGGKFRSSELGAPRLACLSPGKGPGKSGKPEYTDANLPNEVDATLRLKAISPARRSSRFLFGDSVPRFPGPRCFSPRSEER
eukprot:RCo050617